MTDKEKRILKDGVISIFEKFNILDHAATIGGLRDDILRYIDSLQKEPVSEELEEAAKKAATQTIGGVEKFFWNDYHKFKAGAQWQKQQDEHLIWQLSSANYEKGIEEGKKQMMKDAVDTTIAAAPIIGLYINIKCNPEQFRFGDKVKVFVMKED